MGSQSIYDYCKEYLSDKCQINKYDDPETNTEEFCIEFLNFHPYINLVLYPYTGDEYWSVHLEIPGVIIKPYSVQTHINDIRNVDELRRILDSLGVI